MQYILHRSEDLVLGYTRASCSHIGRKMETRATESREPRVPLKMTPRSHHQSKHDVRGGKMNGWFNWAPLRLLVGKDGTLPFYTNTLVSCSSERLEVGWEGFPLWMAFNVIILNTPFWNSFLFFWIFSWDCNPFVHKIGWKWHVEKSGKHYSALYFQGI